MKVLSVRLIQPCAPLYAMFCARSRMITRFCTFLLTWRPVLHAPFVYCRVLMYFWAKFFLALSGVFFPSGSYQSILSALIIGTFVAVCTSEWVLPPTNVIVFNTLRQGGTLAAAMISLLALISVLARGQNDHSALNWSLFSGGLVVVLFVLFVIGRRWYEYGHVGGRSTDHAIFGWWFCVRPASTS